MPVPAIFIDRDSVVFIQEDGPGSAYAAMPCHAIPSTSIGRTTATRIYCKDPGKRGDRIIARTVAGIKEDGTLTINAWSQAQSDLLHRMWQKNCMFGAQTHLDVCGLPTDITAYTKILDYYGIMPGTLDYANVDALEGGEGVGLQLSLSTTYADLIEVLKVALAAVPAAELTLTEDFNAIWGDLTEQCASDCGTDRDRCEIIIAVSDDVAAGVPQCWFSTDSGVNWINTTSNPFPAEAGVDMNTCCITGDRWMAFLGQASTAGLGGACAYADDHGAAVWPIIDMGGTANTDYVTGCYVHDAGNIFVSGGDGAAGNVWHTHDRGATWTLSDDMIVGACMMDIATADGDTIYAVGNANTVMKSTDGGHTWTGATDNGPADSNAIHLQCVRALTNDHVLVGGYIDGANEQLWATFDGGTSWTAMAFEGSTTASTWCKSLDLSPQASRQHVWMVHGVTAGHAASSYAFRSLDGGLTWERWPLLANFRYNKIFACDSNYAWIAGETQTPGATTGYIHYTSPVT